jgi:DNA repair protein RecO (recombination protein O)
MPEGRQIQHHGEAIVLRTWPFHEADLLVSLFTRDQGKIKGVARHAMRSRKRFGGALEPATQVRAHYTERPRQDLVRLDQFEILWSPLTAPIETLRLAGLQLVTEVLEEAMPDQAPEDNIYRLAVTVLASLRSENVWLPTLYFGLWMNRLMGWMPELGHCVACRPLSRPTGVRDCHAGATPGTAASQRHLHHDINRRIPPRAPVF